MSDGTMAPYMMFFPGYFLKSNLTIAIILIFLSIYTVLGNTMVCIVYIKDPGKKLRTVSNHFVLNLSVADILVGVGVEPLNAASNWNSDQRILFSFYITAIISCVCSIVTIAAMMVDRYIAVSRPFKYKVIVTEKRARISLVLIWAFSTHFALMPCLGWQTAGFQVYLYGLGILTPTAFMLFSYAGLLKILKEKTRSLMNSDARTASFAKKAMEREKKISTTVFIMLIVFLVAWCPFVVTDFILVFCPSCRDSETVRLSRDITLVLGFFSSGINPILYAWRVPNFRKGFLSLLCCKGKRRSLKIAPLKNSSNEQSHYIIALDSRKIRKSLSTISEKENISNTKNYLEESTLN